MTPEEEKEKGVTIIGGGVRGYSAMLLAVLEGGGFQVTVSDEDRRLGDPCRPPTCFAEDEGCRAIDDYRDFNNGRPVSHAPPYYTQNKRDVYRNPKGSKKRSR